EVAAAGAATEVAAVAMTGGNYRGDCGSGVRVGLGDRSGGRLHSDCAHNLQPVADQGMLWWVVAGLPRVAEAAMKVRYENTIEDLICLHRFFRRQDTAFRRGFGIATWGVASLAVFGGAGWAVLLNRPE